MWLRYSVRFNVRCGRLIIVFSRVCRDLRYSRRYFGVVCVAHVFLSCSSSSLVSSRWLFGQRYVIPEGGRALRRSIEVWYLPQSSTGTAAVPSFLHHRSCATGFQREHPTTPPPPRKNPSDPFVFCDWCVLIQGSLHILTLLFSLSSSLLVLDGAQIKATPQLFAFGAANLMGSMFSALPGSASLSRGEFEAIGEGNLMFVSTYRACPASPGVYMWVYLV